MSSDQIHDTPAAIAERLRIAFVVDRFGNRFGGAEAYGVELMRELAEKHEITVFAREYDSRCDLKLAYVPIRHWSHWPGWIRGILFARKAAKATAQGFDIVHSHMNGWCGDVEVVHVTPVRFNWRVRPLPWLKSWVPTSARVSGAIWVWKNAVCGPALMPLSPFQA